MTPVEEIVTDEQLESAWGNADFGQQASKRDVIRFALLKYACGYETGHTAKSILQELGLLIPMYATLNQNGLTKKGRTYLFSAFWEGKSF